MSLFDLRDRYVIPAINEREIELSTLLYNSLDKDIPPDLIKKHQDQISGLLALKQYINQNLHQSNDTERLKQFYVEAKRYGLDVEYRERKAIYVDTDTKTTKLQSLRKSKPKSKSPLPAKTKAKPNIKPKAKDLTEEPKPKVKDKDVVEEPKLKLKPKIKAPIKAVKKEINYKWKTDTYAPSGTTTDITFNNTKFKAATFKKTPEVTDAVVNAIILMRDQGESPSDQLSNASALQQVLPQDTVTPEMVSLHNKLKTLVVEK